jgi:hypothetical protein
VTDVRPIRRVRAADSVVDVGEELVMGTLTRWTVEVFVGEDDGRTYAEAALHDDIGNHVLGTGWARLNPADPAVPEIGDEIAVARALLNLGHRLLDVASADIESVTHERVKLSH